MIRSLPTPVFVMHGQKPSQQSSVFTISELVQFKSFDTSFIAIDYIVTKLFDYSLITFRDSQNTLIIAHGSWSSLNNNF